METDASGSVPSSKRRRLNVETDEDKHSREAIRDFVTSIIVHYTNKAYVCGRDGRTLDLKTEYEVSTNLTAILLKWKSSKFIQLGLEVQPKEIKIGEVTITYLELENQVNKEWLNVFKIATMTGKQASFFVKYVSFFGVFGERVKEMHLGVDRIKRYGNLNRTSESAWGSPSSEYGLRPEFRNLCGGINWKPQIKSSLPNTVGPLTALIELWRADSILKKDRWRDVCMSIYSFISGIGHIVDYLKSNNPDANKRLIVGTIGEITVLTGARNVQKFAHCPSTYQTGKVLAYGGLDAFGQYNSLMKEFKTYRSPFEGNIGSEVLLHATVDSFRDDLSVIRAITTKERRMCTRMEMGPIGMHGKDSTKNFTPIKFVYAAKLRSALLSDLGHKGGEGVCTSYAIISGCSKRRITDGMRQKMKLKPQRQIISTDFGEMIDELRRIIQDLYEICNKKDDLNVGTVKWRVVTEAESNEWAETELGLRVQENFSGVPKTYQILWYEYILVSI